jgi:hypothetical protein
MTAMKAASAGDEISQLSRDSVRNMPAPLNGMPDRR